MSQTFNNYKGRYSEPLPTSNLVIEEDYPEFEPFEEVEGEEATPRGHAPDEATPLVVGVDMCRHVNQRNHETSDYDISNLVVRRGLQFQLKVTFSWPVSPEHFQLEFLIGSNPLIRKGSHVVVTFGSREGSDWSGQILKMEGDSLLLGVTPAATAIVGKYRTYVSIETRDGLQRTKRDATTDIYLLFNAWCRDDAVFYPDEAGRREYVLNDSGLIYQGSATSVTQRSWMFGQFERGILDACIYILDTSQMPIVNRSDSIKIVRKASSMINSQDDNGVLVGNWSDDYSGGTPPSMWTGSVKILLQYVHTGVPVCFGQCWVFAGVLNTFLRCLGIPSRVITNFSSAHDNTGNLKTDIIFRPDGTLDRHNTRDSIWNYHCWNEVYMVRKDLPQGLGGWQVVDSTPQETSDGHFRCGPASVAAIKEGLTCHPFDAGFVFAEVNSDVVFMKRDRYGTMKPFKVDKTLVGKSICTKAIGSNGMADITAMYKYPEGSQQDERSMQRAELYGCERDHVVPTDAKMEVTISCDPVYMGQDVHLTVDFHNQGHLPRTVRVHMGVSVIFYTGISASRLKEDIYSITVPANQTAQKLMTVTVQDYLPHLLSQRGLHICVSGQVDGQLLSAIKVVNLLAPPLIVKVSGRPRVQQEMFVTVSFTNPFSLALTNIRFALEGPALISYRTRFFSVIEPFASITWKEVCIPRLGGARRIGAVMGCNILHEVWGECEVFIES